MTRADARKILNTNDAAIQANVEDLYADRVDIDTFRARNRSYHQAIAAAGMKEAWQKRARCR